MATEQTKKSINDVNFKPLGADPGGEQEEVIVEDEQVEQEQQEEQEEVQEEEEQPQSSGHQEEGSEQPSGEEQEEQESSEQQETAEEEGSEQEGSEETEGDSESEPLGIFETTAESLGIDLEENESFQDINFEDPTTDDLAKFVEKASDELTQQRWNKEIESNPELEQFYEYTQNGGDPRQYIETMYPQFDYKEVDFDEHVSGDDQTQEQIVRNHLQATEEYEQDEINEIIEDYRNGGILEKQAKRSLNRLQTMQERQQEKLIEEQRKEKQKRQEEAEQQQQKVKEIIDESEDIKGINIPDTDKQDLKSYLFDPVDEQGRSQAFIDGNQMSAEERVAVAYLKMKGFDLEELVQTEAQTRKAKKIKDSVKGSNKDEEPSGSKRKSKESSRGNVQNIKSLF